MPISTAILDILLGHAEQAPLTELDLSYQQFEMADITFLIGQLSTRTHITGLNLSGCHLNDLMLKPFTQLMGLQILILAGNELTDQSVESLVTMSLLTTLNLNSNRISNKGAALLGSNGRLTSLSLDSNHISLEALLAFGQNVHLKHLSLMNNEITDRGIELLTHHPSSANQVHSLVLSHNYLHDQGLQYLSLFKHLTKVDLSYNRLSSLAISYLSQSFHGQRLNISHNHLGDQGAVKLAQMTQLRELKCAHNQINHIGTRHLAQLKNLEQLDLSYNHLNDEAAKALANTPNLTWLDISHNDIGLEGFQALAMNNDLKTLSLVHSQLDDTHVAILTHMAGLTELNLSNNNIDDAGAQLLSLMSQLTSLKLDSNHIGTQGAKALSKNTSLRSLSLDYNCIGNEGTEALSHNTHFKHITFAFNSPPLTAEHVSLAKTVSSPTLSSALSSQQKSSHEDINQLILYSKILVCIIQEDGIINFCNAYFLNFFGYPAAFVSGKNISSFIHPEDRPTLKNLLTSGTSKDVTLKCLSNSGEHKIINFDFQWKGSIIYLFGTDLSLQKKSQKFISNQIKTEIHQNNAIISKQIDFISHLCHELRNPLSGVISLVDIIYESTKELHELAKVALSQELSVSQKEEYLTQLNHKKEDLEKSLSDVRICCHYQEEILNDNLDVTKILEGKIVLNEEMIDIKQELQKVIHINQSKCLKKGLTLELCCEPKDDYLVKGDAMRIKQIALNLVNNAIKFTEKGQVTVTLAALETTGDKTHFSLTVCDTGIGLKEEELNTLFGRYTQANLSIGSQYGGSGLGLYIARRLAQQMGGDLTVSSKLGVGSQFSCDLFCHNLSCEEKMTVTAQNQASPMIPPSALRQAHTCSALVVEDNDINIKVLTYMLQKMGHICHVAHDGLEAVQYYRDHHQQLDIIFMDTYMPKMSGLEAIATIRQIEQDQHLTHMPIITLSGNALESDKVLALKAGADGYMIKPFKKLELAKAIDQWTRTRSQSETRHHPESIMANSSMATAKNLSRSTSSQSM